MLNEICNFIIIFKFIYIKKRNLKKYGILYFELFHLSINFCNQKCFNHAYLLFFHFNSKEKHLKMVQIGRIFHFSFIIGPIFHHALTTNSMY